MSASSGVFSDFCQAWVARFPGSGLPAAWEEDVRANLKKHKTKVAILREELEKEEMYVEYLNKLLVEIEEHRKKSLKLEETSLDDEDDPVVAALADEDVVCIEDNEDEVDVDDEDEDEIVEDLTVESMNEENKRRSDPIVDVDDFLELEPEASDLGRQQAATEEGAEGPSTFITVINVPSSSSSNGAAAPTRKASLREKPSEDLVRQKSKPVPVARTLPSRGASRESLVSSPPTSPVISSSIEELAVPASSAGTAAATAAVNSSISSSSEDEEVEQTKEAVIKTTGSSPSSTGSVDLRRSHPVAKRSLTAGGAPAPVVSGTFEKRRGQPDGRDREEEGGVNGARRLSEPGDRTTPPPPPVGPRPSKVKALSAKWEKKQPSASSQVKPSRVSKVRDSSPAAAADIANGNPAQRKDSDSSSRGRMGSPSGKSHDSSDSENHGAPGGVTNNNWPHQAGAAASRTSSGSSSGIGGLKDPVSPGSSRRRVSGETRLDRLVRRPSGGPMSEKPTPPPTSGIPVFRGGQAPRVKPRSLQPGPAPVSGGNNNEIIETCFQVDEEEPLYDTVANDVGEDEYYDNHLLYGGQGGPRTTTGVADRSSDTIRSGGGSSADLGFDEPSILQHAQLPPLKTASVSGLSLTDRSTGTGTLSSSGTTDTTEGLLSTSPSLRRGISYDDESQNYVNIQYFLQQQQQQKKQSTGSLNRTPLTPTSVQSDDETLSPGPPRPPVRNQQQQAAHKKLAAAQAAPSDVPPPLPAPNQRHDAERIMMYKCILNSIVDSEAIYLEGLSVMVQYMNAMKVTMSTPHPVIPKEDFEVIFYKIPELHDLHYTFHESLKRQAERWNGSADCTIGHTFKMLASRTKVYSAYLANYAKALEALHRCSETYPQFAELTRSIKLRSVGGAGRGGGGQSLSLEDLLHKPVARVQKNCLSLQDLIKYTLATHPDYEALNQALQTVQSFVNDYNSSLPPSAPPPAPMSSLAPELLLQQASPPPPPPAIQQQQQMQRHLVKNSFIVELSEGHRKLRHLFLFNDVLVCAKYKQSTGSKNEKFTFQLKWYIPLCHALIVETPSSEPKESSPANLVALKTQTSELRDQIRRIEKDEDFKHSSRRSVASGQAGSGGSTHPAALKATEKHRKKLAELEAQLVLASPSLLFQVAHKQGRVFSFYLSSEYERSQWVESLQVSQKSLPISAASASGPVTSMSELQTWITNSRKYLKTNMGSFLMRSSRDEPLLVGDLVLKVKGLYGLTRPCDLYVVLEVDSYGHFFRKSKTRTIKGAGLDPVWDEEFVIELEGSENLRVLVYEQPEVPARGSAGHPVLRGRANLELSRTWLTNKMTDQRVAMDTDVVLECSMKYVTFEETIRRVPHNKSGSSAGLFGAPIAVTCRKEKRAVPFVVTSCVREVERRGINEVGIYRVSGSAADVGRLKRAYETNPYEAEQLLKECDIHSVAGVLKQFLRDLPESIFTSQIYSRLFEAYSSPGGGQGDANEVRKHAYLNIFSSVPQNPNQACIVFLVEHMVKVAQCEHKNKMSLHNLATIFGPNMLFPEKETEGGRGGGGKGAKAGPPTMATGTVDVMAQAGILYFFLTRRARGEPIQIVERQV